MIHHTFKGIQPGDTVRYKTPQGQVVSGRANPLLLFGFHVVVDRGAGQPAVVNAQNYVSHRGKHGLKTVTVYRGSQGERMAAATFDCRVVDAADFLGDAPFAELEE